MKVVVDDVKYRSLDLAIRRFANFQNVSTEMLLEAARQYAIFIGREEKQPVDNSPPPAPVVAKKESTKPKKRGGIFG